MTHAQKKAIDIINWLPEEKLGNVLSYLQYVKSQEVGALILQPDDEQEIKEILAENAFITADELQQKIDEAAE